MGREDLDSGAPPERALPHLDGLHDLFALPDLAVCQGEQEGTYD